MTEKINAALHKYEKLVEKGKIRSFSVYIQEEGILILPEGAGISKEVDLIQELMTSLRVFFYGVPSIEHNSYDYVTLKSFINASACASKMAS
ncbi:hypothetical protein DXT99_13780 [Pontibacter diazotrophicus]|uniref:Uncharacterized protein n=1 Tax=Pontibacter diazotrophicus TaxID=1400979 RepID=A0A3D8LAL7_9BACT|nr:hypothetical protein [Pontibacter diazotrophicus]RDV14471.1 hypothetical protein DXT99_13780 [Pontibacter diazotrophicus]